MFASEEKLRKVIEKIIEETEAGTIVWSDAAPQSQQSYCARWRGWDIIATYFHDETSVRMVRGKKSVGMSYRVMEGLKEAILDQISPHWRAAEKKRVRENRRLAKKCARATEKLIDKILKL